MRTASLAIIVILILISFALIFVSFLLANLVSLTSMEISSFIVYSLAPTMVLNSLLLLILQPVLEKVYLW